MRFQLFVYLARARAFTKKWKKEEICLPVVSKFAIFGCNLEKFSHFWSKTAVFDPLLPARALFFSIFGLPVLSFLSFFSIFGLPARAPKVSHPPPETQFARARAFWTFKKLARPCVFKKSQNPGEPLLQHHLSLKSQLSLFCAGASSTKMP